MQKLLLLTTACLFLVPVLVNSQDFARMFKPLLQKQDTAAQIKLLKTWHATNPKDPEIFVAYFNYYAQVSATGVVSIGTDKKAGGFFVLTDSGSNKPVGYLSSSVRYNPAILQKGFDYIDTGIAMNPARLDMRFGRIYMLGQAENYPEFAKTVIETINYGHTINDAWLWKEDKPLEDAKNFFLASIQTYITTIYNTENDSLLPLMRQISLAVLQYNPTHVESLANVALTYLITGEYGKALDYLLQAEKVAPKDAIVLNNIAEAYKRKGDKANAKAYLKKVIKFGNPDEQEDAKARLQELGE